MEASSVEVHGIPPEVADELLVLYFENRRRSGGGAVRECRRWRGGGGGSSSRAVLTFEHRRDAQEVLSRGSHVLCGAQLLVQPAAPRDYGKVLLQGLSPQTDQDLLELYVQRLLGCAQGSASIHRSPAGDHALVQLPEPLGDAEFLALAEQVQRQPLDGTSLGLDWVEQTDSLLVRSQGSCQLSQDMLELYFESRRSGGGPVQAVRLLLGGSVAIVSFQDRAVAERVRQRTHRLQDNALDVSPYYEFLEPLEEEDERGTGPVGDWGSGGPLICMPLPEAAAIQRLLQLDLVLQELSASVPKCTLAVQGASLHVLGGDPALRRQLQQHVQEALQGVAEERLPFPAWILSFLQRKDVQEHLAELLVKRGLGACYVPDADAAAPAMLVVALWPSAARQAASLLSSSLCSFSLPLSEQHLLALTSSGWARVQTGLPCCLVRLADSGEHLEGLTLSELEQGNVAQLMAFLEEARPDETLVPMEAGTLRYLQLYSQELLASIASVSLLPLEGPDITGLRLSGEAGACKAAAELLQSLLTAVHTQTVSLQLPGVSRFLLDERGRAVVQGVERRFRCVIELDRIRWHPVATQHLLELSQTPLALSAKRDAQLDFAQRQGGPGGVTGEWSKTHLEEIKGLLASLRQSSRAAEEEPSSKGSSLEDLDPGPEAEGTTLLARAEQARASDVPVVGDGGEMALETPLAGPDSSAVTAEEEEEEEEAAQLLLAIQQSMDSARKEDEALHLATELSLHSYQQEQEQAASSLLSALHVSLECALQAADSVQLVVCAPSEDDVGPLAQELERALQAQLREETVHNEALRSLPALCHDYLTHLEQKHAVRISLGGSVATVCGFADYPVAATRDLALLLARLVRPEAGPSAGAEGVRWVHWESSGRCSPTPYSAQTSALLEEAWRRGDKRMDILFDGRPFTIDFERMEEYDVGNARVLPIGRTEPPASLTALSGPIPLAEDEVMLVPLAEGTEEFRDTVRHFYATLAEFHSKIRLVKVEKLLHPLLYQQYQLKKAAMEKACGHQSVERILYHGTTEQSSREICRHGFNRSFCGKNATRYGQGVYFATKAFVSVQDQFSPCDVHGNKYVFVTRTLVGAYTVGSQHLRAPPLREGDALLRRYDSVVDNLNNPAIFVIFNDTQAYPQYLLTCQRSKPR